MLQLLTCSKGHSWEAAAADDGAAAGRAVCPVCGEAVELLPLFDLAPSPEAITADPQPVLPQAPPLRDAAGKPVVAGYEIQEDLGRTPLGVRLFRAKQVLVNRPVLLKVVVAREDPGQTGWGALRGEAAALGKLSHPNIVQILDAGERERQLFYNAVEWIDGPTLAEHAGGGPMAPLQAARLVEVLARAVHAAHEQGVVHRGLRPACIRLQPQPERAPTRGGRAGRGGPVEPPFYLAGGATRCLPKIGDFGLARRLVEGDAADLELYEDQPSYLSPEQAWGRSREIGPASDVYALGAILFELLGGRPPFRGRTAGETLDLIRTGDPPSLYRHARNLPVDLASVCRKAMQRNPRNRYRTALDFAEDLRAFTSSRPVAARQTGAGTRFAMWVRRRPAAAALLLVCLLAAVGVLTAYLIGAAGAYADKEEMEKQKITANNAESQRSLLQVSLTDAQKREQRSAYLHRILLADEEYRAGSGDRARQLLDECPPDQRGWEWRFLNYRFNLFGAPDHVSLTGAEQPITAVAFSPDGRWLAASSGGGDPPKWEVRVWDSNTGETVHVLTDLPGPVARIAFSPDGRRLAVASAVPGNFGETSGEVKEWDPAQGVVLATHDIKGVRATDLAYSADGQRLVVVDGHGWLHPFTVDPRRIAILPAVQTGDDGQDRNARLALLSPDGGKAAVSVLGMAVQIFDTSHGRVGVPAMQHANTITALAFSPETNLLATASDDGTAKVWDVQLNRLVATLSGQGAATDVSFTRDGRRLAVAGVDGQVRLWDPATGQEVYQLTPFEKDAGADNGVTAVRFGPVRDDGRLAAVHGTEVRIFGPPRP